MSDKAKTEAPELLVDGSFESASVKSNSWGHQKTVGGWRSDTEVEVWGKGFYGLKATDGDKIAELDYDRGVSNIYQDVATEAGTEYTFSFDFMKRPDSKAGSDTINVYWNGKLVGTVDPTKSEWSRAEFGVWCERVASAYGYSVRIEPLGDVDPAHGAPSQMGVFTR